MRLQEYADQYGIKYRAAWNRYKLGKIPGAYTDDFGRIHVPAKNEGVKNAAIYARVSTTKQSADLERQVERLTSYAQAKGYTITQIVKEIASGVNDTRPKLSKLLGKDDWNILVIEHKDRLTRTDFNWFELLLNQTHRVIDVSNLVAEQTHDLMDDFVSIIYSFSARLYGSRGAKNRSAAIIKTLESSHD